MKSEKKEIFKLKCSQCGYEPKEGEHLLGETDRDTGKTEWYCYRCVSGEGSKNNKARKTILRSRCSRPSKCPYTTSSIPQDVEEFRESNCIPGQMNKNLEKEGLRP